MTADSAGRQRRSRRFASLAILALAAASATARPVQAVSLIAVADSYSVVHDHTLAVAAPGVLANDPSLLGGGSAIKDTNPSHGSVNLQADGGFTYIPVAGFVGQDAFQYHVQGLLSSLLPATVTLTVTNSAPTATNDQFAAETGVTLSVPAPGVLTNDADADGDRLTAQLVDGGGNGSLDLNADGSFTFKSGGSFTGDRTFTYRVTDGIAWSATATVTIAVSSPGATPPATPAPLPTLALPTLPIPLPSLPLPLPSATVPLPSTPILEPSRSPSTSSRPSPDSSAGPIVTPSRPSSDPAPSGVEGREPAPSDTRGPDGADAGQDARGGGGDLTVPTDVFDLRDGLAIAGIGSFDWAVPSLVLSVPGLLLILAIAAQATAGLLSVPFVRRWLGNFGLGWRRRRERRP